jgi:hypothetical protein
MRISTRLILASDATIVVVMLAAGLVAQRKREALLVDAHLRETETLARTLNLVAAEAQRDGRMADLDAVLESVAADPATAAVVLVDAHGAIRAGGPIDAAACLREIPFTRGGTAPAEQSGIAQCGGRVDWVALASATPGETLLLARSITFVEREAAAPGRRAAGARRGFQPHGRAARRQASLPDPTGAGADRTRAAPAPGGKVRRAGALHRRCRPRTGQPAERRRLPRR